MSCQNLRDFFDVVGYCATFALAPPLLHGALGSILWWVFLTWNNLRSFRPRDSRIIVIASVVQCARSFSEFFLGRRPRVAPLVLAALHLSGVAYANRFVLADSELSRAKLQGFLISVLIYEPLYAWLGREP